MHVPSERLLLGPGPSPVHPRVSQALSWPTLGHLDPEFVSIMRETGELLRSVFQTNNPLTLPISGTGSAGMEAALVNFIEPGDRVIVATCGLFGDRMWDIAGRCGADVVRIEAPWGSPIDPADVVRELNSGKPVKAVAVVHAETSTGVLQDLVPLAEACRSHGCLFIVDTVTSLGGVDVPVDRLGLDVVYSGSQKCLNCPPGLAPLTAGARALEVLRKRRTKVSSWYLDLSMIMQYWGQERFYHHTAPVNMIYGLHEALALIMEEGLEARFARHREHSQALVAGLSSLGLAPLAADNCRLPTLTAVRIPGQVDDAEIRGRLLTRYGIEIGGGLGPLKGRIWRIGLMGHGATRRNVMLVLTALGQELQAARWPCSPTEALAAAEDAYRQ